MDVTNPYWDGFEQPSSGGTLFFSPFSAATNQVTRSDALQPGSKELQSIFHLNMTLRILADLLRTSFKTLHRMGGDAQVESALVGALHLANEAIEDQSRNIYIRSTASEIASLTLTAVARIFRLVLDFNARTVEEQKYCDVLLPPFGSLGSLHAVLLKHITSTHSNREQQIKNVNRIIRNIHSGLLLKIEIIEFGADSLPRPPEYRRDGDSVVHWASEIRWGEPVDTPGVGIVPQGLLRTFWGGTQKAIVHGKQVVVKMFPRDDYYQFLSQLEFLRQNRLTHVPALYGRSPYRRGHAPIITLAIDNPQPFRIYLAELFHTRPQAALEEVWKMFVALRSPLEHLLKGGYCTEDWELIEALQGAIVPRAGQVMLMPDLWRHNHGVPQADSQLVVTVVKEFFDEIFGTGETFAPYLQLRKLPVEWQWCILHPFIYAMRLRPADTLDLSHIGQNHGRRMLARLRPGHEDVESRLIRWPTSDPAVISSLAVQPAVGDIGTFSRGDDGQSIFGPLTNVQSELGGFDILTLAQEVSPGISKFLSLGGQFFPWMLTEWKSYIPPSVALDFLLNNGVEIAEKFGVGVDDLAIVTDITMDVKVTGSQPLVNDPAIFGHFDDQGRLVRCYLALQPFIQEQDGAHSSSNKPSIDHSVSVYLCMNTLRVDVYEIQQKSAEGESQSRVQFPMLGDLGYFQDRDAGSPLNEDFIVVSNLGSDLSFHSLHAWKGNDCEDLGNGVWRSPWLVPGEDISQLYTWKSSAILGLPDTLKPFYLRQCLPATSAVVTNRPYQIIQEVSIQIVATILKQSQSCPYRLFVHFGDSGLPLCAYWSKLDAPLFPLDSTVQDDGFAVSISLTRSGLSKELVIPPFDTNFRPILSTEASQRFGGSRIGDVGFQISEGVLADQWVPLGDSHSPLLPRSLAKHTASSGFGPCKCVRKDHGFWQSEPFLYLPNTRLVEYTWEEELPNATIVELCESLGEISRECDISPNDLLLVTKVTTSVHATIIPHNDNKYKLVNAPRVYVVLPPEGGCYAYWSGELHAYADPRLLAKFDVEGCRTEPGCNIQISWDVEHESLTKLRERLYQG